MFEYQKDNLKVEAFSTRKAMGDAAANFVGNEIKKLASNQDQIRIIFAAAVSQIDFFEAFLKLNLPWQKITALHMDEYHTLDENAPQKFGKFLEQHLFSKANFGAVHYLSDIEEYQKIIEIAPIDIVCLGIGENGHLAFNDPPIAKFDDSEWIKIVELDEICRQQQVNDGAFNKIDEVPKTAVTLTIPALMSGKMLSIVVPGKSKALAIRNTLLKEISEECPASVTRTHQNATLFLDKNSVELLNEEIP